MAKNNNKFNYTKNATYAIIGTAIIAWVIFAGCFYQWFDIDESKKEWQYYLIAIIIVWIIAGAIIVKTIVANLDNNLGIHYAVLVDGRRFRYTIMCIVVMILLFAITDGTSVFFNWWFGSTPVSVLIWFIPLSAPVFVDYLLRDERISKICLKGLNHKDHSGVYAGYMYSESIFDTGKFNKGCIEFGLDIVQKYDRIQIDIIANISKDSSTTSAYFTKNKDEDVLIQTFDSYFADPKNPDKKIKYSGTSKASFTSDGWIIGEQYNYGPRSSRGLFILRKMELPCGEGKNPKSPYSEEEFTKLLKLLIDDSKSDCEYSCKYDRLTKKCEEISKNIGSKDLNIERELDVTKNTWHKMELDNQNKEKIYLWPFDSLEKYP